MYMYKAVPKMVCFRSLSSLLFVTFSKSNLYVKNPNSFNFVTSNTACTLPFMNYVRISRLNYLTLSLLTGGVPMSHVDYKKWLCHPVDFQKTSCHPVDFKKTPCRPVNFKKTPCRPVKFKKTSCRMSLMPKKGRVAVSILRVNTPTIPR